MEIKLIILASPEFWKEPNYRVMHTQNVTNVIFQLSNQPMRIKEQMNNVVENVGCILRSLSSFLQSKESKRNKSALNYLSQDCVAYAILSFLDIDLEI